MLLVTVTDVEMVPGQTVATATATREDGATIVFGGDWRPMADLAEAVAEEGEVLAYIEVWQILSLDESTATPALSDEAALAVLRDRSQQ